MLSFETEIREYCKEYNIDFEDHGDSSRHPDFKLGDVWLEVKEKGNLNPKNWPITGDGKTVFIVDELTMRRLMTFAPKALLAFRDNKTGRYYVADVFTVWLMPRKRVRRPVAGKKYPKGKWLLDIRNFKEVFSIKELLDYAMKFDGGFYANTFSDCMGEFLGEQVYTTDNVRHIGYQNTDFLMTR